MKTTNVTVVCAAVALAACSPNEGSAPVARPSLEDWAKGALQTAETLLCVAKHEEDYFYVSRVSPHVMRVASQLSLRHVGFGSASTLEAWSFRAPNGASLLGPEPPRNVRVASPTKHSPFVESVSDYTLNTSGNSTVTISVAIKRCPDPNCKMTEPSRQEETYRAEICTVPAS